MLSVLVLAMNAEAQPLGMTINWSKTQIQDDLGGCGAPCQHVSVQGNEVEVVESFVYLGSLILCSGSSELEIKRRIPLLSVSPCLHWTRTSGDLISHGNQAPALQYVHSPNISLWF